jgi:hypothetical protein
MDNRRFDALVQSFAQRRNRRTVLKSMFGLGASAVAFRGMAGETEAARRGFSGPTFPTPTPPPCVDGSAECVVPQGGTSIKICNQGTWETYECLDAQECISYPNLNDFCEITT